MNLAESAPQWLAGIFALLLVAAAVQDAARLRISNILCLLVLVGAFVAVALEGPEGALWQNIVVFGALLAAGTPLFAAGKFGGGDVKLLASVGLWFDFWGALQMIVSVFIAGGLLALVVLGLRMFGWSEKARQRVQLLRPRSGIPYGVAIALGALTAVAMQRQLL